MCPAAGIFHSIWTQCTTSNMGSQIFVFLNGPSYTAFLESRFSRWFLSWLKLQQSTCHVGNETVVCVLLQCF